MSQPAEAPSKIQLEDVYRKHHERGKRYGYLFCHGKRGPFIKRWIGTGKKVIDFGCRDGELTKFYCEGNDVLGVDIDRKALELIQEKHGVRTEWRNLNEEFPEGSEVYDSAVACEILEHIYQENRFIENVANLLKPNGIFIGSVPNAFRLKNRFKFLFGKEFDTDPTHVHIFSVSSLRQKLLKHFKEVEIVPIGGKILPFWSVTESSPRQLNALFGKDLLWKAVK